MKKLIKDTLKELNPEIPYSIDAEKLLLGTAAQESKYGKYVYQIGGGSALGKFQMETETFNDICENFLASRPNLMAKIIQITSVDMLNSDDLVTNDKLATCMARVHYFRQKGAIPKTLLGQANYWKDYYNTFKGKGTVEEYIENYLKYVLKVS